MTQCVSDRLAQFLFTAHVLVKSTHGQISSWPSIAPTHMSSHTERCCLCSFPLQPANLSWLEVLEGVGDTNYIPALVHVVSWIEYAQDHIQALAISAQRGEQGFGVRNLVPPVLVRDRLTELR